VDPDEYRFHLVAQLEVRRQLNAFLDRMRSTGVRVGLDLAVGVHPDGYEAWARQGVFARGMSVGAPPDGGFPSGQDWGFHPVHPEASRREGHRYLAQSIAHQAELCGVLRVDHVMALARLYWIPHGLPLSKGTYVSYPVDELFAVLTLESHRHRCEVVGENLGTVPDIIDRGLPLHDIWGMFLAQFEAHAEAPHPPGDREMALIGTHDTPTFSGWIDGVDIDERVRCDLLDAEAAPAEREERTRAANRLAAHLGQDPANREAFLGALLEWLGRSPSPLVVPWLEDLWLETEGVNLPGTPSWVRPNFQRVMRRPLDDALKDPSVNALVNRLQAARSRAS
jgi:4-alpha-glucanotransferase